MTVADRRIDDRRTNSLLVRRIHHLERIDDPVHVRGTLALVSRADDVKDLVAAMKAVQAALIG